MTCGRSNFNLPVCLPVYNYISRKFKPFTSCLNGTHTPGINNYCLTNSKFYTVTSYARHLFRIGSQIKATEIVHRCLTNFWCLYFRDSCTTN